MDWTKTGYPYELSVNVVSQLNVKDVLGSLTGIQLDGTSMTENYYSDSRVQGKVVTLVPIGTSDGYIENARLRIILSIPSKNWTEPLMTGYVSDVDIVEEKGYVKRTYTLEGTIWGLLEHKTKAPITIGKSKSLLAVWRDLINSETRMQYNTEKAQDHIFGSTVVYEAGTSLSTVLFEITSGYNRMDTDGRGYITLQKYTPPSKQAISRVIDYNDLKTLIMEPLSTTTTSYEAPGRTVVTATISKSEGDKTVQQVIVGSYDAPEGHPTSIGVRGYLRGRSDTYTGSSESPTITDLNTQAKNTWTDSQDKGIEMSASSIFANYHAGEICSLIAPVGGNQKQTSTRKVLISAVSTNFQTLVQELTMKEL